MAFLWFPPRHLGGNYCVFPSVLRQLENEEIREIPNRGRELMEIAGREVARHALSHFPDARDVLVFCGKGNNGGDGFVAAYYLQRCGLGVHLFIFGEPAESASDARFMFERVRSLPRTVIHTASDAGDILEWCRHRDILVIDAIFGTGYKPSHNPLMTRVYQCIAELSCPVLAVDMPSGIDAATGFRGSLEDEDPPRALMATETVTFGAPKIGQFVGEGPAYCGQLHCVDIGLRAMPSGDLRVRLLDDAYCERTLRAALRRSPDAHKGMCGHVVVVGGAESMPGACCMAARGALRAGCGLVTIAARAPLRAHDEIMVSSIAPTGTLELERFQGILAHADCLVVGPGLGRDDTARAIMEACQSFPGRIVLDADALWALSEQKYIFASPELYLTPHLGEAARLMGCTPREVARETVDVARTLAAHFSATVILKSHATVIASRASRVQPPRCALNPYPNPAVATAGAGDVLAGILAGILAQARGGACARWLDPFDVASLAVHLHSRAGREAARTRGDAVVASDILDNMTLATV